MFLVYEEMKNGVQQIIDLLEDRDDAIQILDQMAALEPNKTYGVAKDSV